MNRTSNPRAVVLRAVGVLVAVAAVTPAHAQMDVGQAPDEPWWADPDVQHGGAGGDWLEDRANTSGRAIVLGRGGSLGPRVVPPRYTVRRGDTLWDITGRFYGNPWQWPRVWSYNPEITNPHWIYPDDVVRLRAEGEAEAPTLPGAEPGAAPRRRPAAVAPESVFLREQGYLDADALETAGEIAGSPEEQMLLSPYDEVYVQFEGEPDVRPGQELTIFRRYEDDDRLEEEEGTLVRILGTVQVRTYDPERKLARAIITEALDPIERGFEVADVPRRFEMVAPVRNEVDLVTEVVATLRPLEMLADQQIIFVPVGAEQGVREGNRFFIVRTGDDWREHLESNERTAGATEPGADEPEEYPPEVIAEARVVDVRPNSSTLFITRSVREIAIGDRAEMRAGF